MAQVFHSISLRLTSIDMETHVKYLLSFLFVFLFAFSAYAEDIESRIKNLEDSLKSQEKAIIDQQHVIEGLKAEKEFSQEAAVEGQRPDRPAAGSGIRLIDISLDALFAAGGSTENDETLQNLQGGGHDPRKRGFTAQNIELSLIGAVDPYMRGEAHIIYFLDPLTGETRVELEETFLTTTSLPYKLQLEAGHFFTEFGRINPQHPHRWHWQDQPVINTRLFGPDGMRGPGFRLGWLLPFSWFSELHFGAQNANGETMASFLANEEFFDERAIGNRPFVNRGVKTLKDMVYLLRLDNSLDLSDEVTTKLGLSGLYGPNATGNEGETFIYGADLVVKWRPTKGERGWPFLIWETEIMKRDYKAAAFFDDSDPAAVIALSEETLNDWGFYTQLLYGFKPGWAAGLRYEYATGSGESVGGRESDPFRDDRSRISPLVTWMPTEFSRFRVQYNYDRASHLSDKQAHSVWFGIEFMYGAHATHSF